jgi:predicted nucleic acid-binding protein
MFKSLYELLQLIPGGPGFLTSSIRVRLVLDANVVQGELRWRLKRKKPAARSDLQEAIDSGIITAVAPTFLESEIEEHLPRIAAATKKSVLEAKAEWLDFRARIQLYAPKSSGDAADHAVDPDDVLYKVTCEELGADAIFTNDRDLKAMNVPVIGGRPERALRDAARSNSVVLGITVGTGLVVTVSYGFLRSVYWMLDATLQGFRSLPGWVKLLIIGVGLYIVSRPEIRAKIAEAWSHLTQFCQSMAPGVLETISRIATDYVAASQRSEQVSAELRSSLPSPPRRSAIQHARAICLASPQPITTTEIIRRMEMEGYKSRSKAFDVYLRRLMRESKQFDQSADDFWQLSKTSPRPFVLELRPGTRGLTPATSAPPKMSRKP